MDHLQVLASVVLLPQVQLQRGQALLQEQWQGLKEPRQMFQQWQQVLQKSLLALGLWWYQVF